MAEIAGKRLLVVEEALKDFVGHWYEYVKAVAELSRAAGAEVTVVGHADANAELRRDPRFHALFERTLWDGDYRHGPALLRKFGLVRHNWLVFRRMRGFLKIHGPFDRTFVPTVVGHHVWAWRLLSLLYPRQIGPLVLLVRNSSSIYRAGAAAPRFKLAARLFKWGLRSFTADIAAGRAVFATDSERLADEYRALCGIAPMVFPSPRVATPPAASAKRQRNAPVRFACLGPARFEKGIDVLQRAIALYVADPAPPPARFVIQWPTPIRDASGDLYPPDPGLTASGAVELLTDPLASAAYEALLARIDCMVLPYRRDAYFARISGVAVEAVTAGIPVIATADTWTGAFVEASGAGLTVRDGDAAALAEAMLQVARAYPSFRKRALAKREAALATHSGDAFLAKLWG